MLLNFRTFKLCFTFLCICTHHDCSMTKYIHKKFFKLISLVNKMSEISSYSIISTSSEEKDDHEYEVEKIIDHKMIDGKIFFKIRWKGYTENEDTWEKNDDLKCIEVIDEYMKAQSQNLAQIKKDRMVQNIIQTILYGTERNNKITYRVQYIDGREADLSSVELRVNYPRDLLKFLETTSFGSGSV
ncbi:hypothetical protein TRFO_22940 [Tritrichomonas foetus]|uniref:Chromo domain-containing protein n=1 Tax=Tritrichomonas foetus TaxID=1144522 RepID=A0A1J4KFV4_9EUKA|nr:hypothetical protein TRFO_22940 [Tritrichomonas foetus]|eukprot:OHT08518.1 hypothetical protein TRFO_22940 [Tritrichomonas foetus]